MYALIENQKVIGVFEETENVTLTDGQTVVPIDENCFFWLIGGDAVFGVLTKVDEWQIETNENSYELSEVDSWQPIGEWRPF